MTCPECKNEMDAGYLYIRGTGGALFWGTTKDVGFFTREGLTPIDLDKVSVTQRARIAPARFAQKHLSILLDTHILREHARGVVSPFEARLPLRGPSAVSLKAKLRIER